MIREQPVDLARDFVVDWPHGDAEDSLTLLKKIDDLFGAACGVDRGTIGQKGDVTLPPALSFLLL